MKPVFKLTNAEARLAELLWANAPVASVEMAELAERAFGWKKSTTSTIIKSLIHKGLAKNEESGATMLRTRDEVIVEQSSRSADGARSGCLPMFIVSHTRELSPVQAEEIRPFMDEREGGGEAYELRYIGKTAQKARF